MLYSYSPFPRCLSKLLQNSKGANELLFKNTHRANDCADVLRTSSVPLVLQIENKLGVGTLGRRNVAARILPGGGGAGNGTTHSAHGQRFQGPAPCLRRAGKPDPASSLNCNDAEQKCPFSPDRKSSKTKIQRSDMSAERSRDRGCAGPAHRRTSPASCPAPPQPEVGSGSSAARGARWCQCCVAAWFGEVGPLSFFP